MGSLLYISTCTRPDISYAVSVLCRSMHSPGQQDMQRLRYLLRYLKGTAHRKLKVGTTKEELQGYSDASYADDLYTRRSTGGYVFSFKGGCISWRSSLQKTVALSTAEAEYMALSSAAQEGLFLQQLLEELELVKDRKKLQLFTDNQAAKAIAEQPSPSARSKHIAVRWHFLRQHVDAGSLHLQYVPTDKQLADILTKPLLPAKFHTAADQVLKESESTHTQSMAIMLGNQNICCD